MSIRQDNIKKMELKQQAKQQAGLLSEKFPKVTLIILKMTYYRKSENPVLMERTVNIFPTSPAYFIMECMICDSDGGGFNLNPVINKLIKARKKSAKGTLVCKGSKEGLPPEHASISYNITIKYKK